MYTKEPEEQQYSFTHDWFIIPDVDENHELIRIAKTIDWLNLSNKLSGFYCADNGRRSKPSRAKVGLHIIKHLYQKSDADVVDLLKRDIYIQYLCNISPREAKEFIDPSSLSKFRKQIGIEGIKIIEEEIQRTINKVKPPKGRRLVTDTTVVPSNIAYPTDVSLLEKVRRKAVEFIDKAKHLGSKSHCTYKRVAKKVYIQYQKVHRHSTKSRRKTIKKLLQFATRNINQLKESVDHFKKQSENVPVIEDAQDFLETAEEILNQQKDLYRKREVKDRIVSVHQPHIRPMVRGKYPVDVEFGPKVLLNLDDDYLFLEDLHFNNVSDTHLLEKAIEGYHKRRGRPPTQLAADRGFWSQDNHNKAEALGIQKVAIENKGKSNHLKGKPFAKRLRRLRCKIEAKISLAKRKFGLNRCRYLLPNGEEMWIRLGLSVMNLKHAMRYG
ncbi:MAG: IS5 family transposase [Candidatus Omnitrophica bacterium]|nr:IS5 family transposase [Candidatus Omnitrophota bacterium]